MFKLVLLMPCDGGSTVASAEARTGELLAPPKLNSTSSSQPWPRASPAAHITTSSTYKVHDIYR